MSDLAADQKAPETCSLVAGQAGPHINMSLFSRQEKQEEREGERGGGLGDVWAKSTDERIAREARRQYAG